jgi:hypothetical protein
MTAFPSSALCSRGRPAAGWAAFSAWLGFCSRSAMTSAASAIAIVTIPPASHSAGVNQASSVPSATQLSEVSASDATSPARPPRSAQASANSASTQTTLALRARPARQLSDSSASAGTATRAR